MRRAVLCLAMVAALSCVASAHPATGQGKDSILAFIPPPTFTAPTPSFARDKGADILPALIYCLALLQLHQYDAADAACTRVVVLDPSNAQAYRMRGASLLARKRFAMARADFDRAIVLEPDDADGYALRATAWREEERYDLSISDFSAAIARNPDDGRMWNGRCWVRALQGRALGRAMSDCRRALALDPYDANVLDSMGFIALRQLHYQDALRHYDGALILDPDLATSYFGRGLAKAHLYGLARARDDVASALKLDPSSEDAFIKAGLIDVRSPLIRCGGEQCPSLPHLGAPHRPLKKQGPAGSVRVTRIYGRMKM